MSNDELCRYIKLYHKTVFRVAYSWLQNSEDSDDVCQDVFLKLYMTTEEFSSDENCKAWLIRVTINHCKNVLKSFRYTRTDELDDSIPYMNRSERGLMESISELPPKYRIVIHLHYFEGYSLKEIGRILRISESGAASRLSRAREKLRKLLGNDEQIVLKEGRV